MALALPNYAIGIIAGVALLILLFFICGYVKAPPNKAYIISGVRRKKKILIGRAGIRIPLIERLDKLSLDVMQVDIKTSEAIPTNEFINVTVDGVANIKISSNPELLEKAAESLLGMDQRQLIFLVTQVLEGNMREIVGSVGLKEMVQERQIVAEKIKGNAIPDMQKLGIEIVNFNIQNFKDGAGTIENMGIDNVEQIRKAAQIAKAEAARDIAIAEANARESSNKVAVEANQRIAEQNTMLAIREAELKKDADVKKAEADAAYDIQKQEQRKTIEVTSANADIARREKEAELFEKEIALQEKKLDAEIKKKADALKYEAEKRAEADLIRRQKESEAKRYEQEQEALARMKAAEAEKYEQERQAEAKRAIAEAEAYAKMKEAEGIRAVGLAEAEAIEKKAEAQKKMGEASVLEMYLNALPEVVKNAAAPLAQTDKIVMYGDGNSTKLLRDVMQSSNQVMEGLSEATGLDVKSMISGFMGGKAAAATAASTEEKK
ncbi:MAG: flotillin family protein [Clostridia bacterium]|nr:flotillin family protein [Clostridia bacterium]